MKMKKVDFVFEYEVKPREFISICLLAAYLKNKGYSVALLNSWQSLYQKPAAYDAVVAVISACYDDGTYDFFTGHIARFQKVLNLQWEQVLGNYYYENSANLYQGTGLVTPHICWGEQEKMRLQNTFGIEEKYLKVLGYLPLDFYREELRPRCPSREELFTQYGLDPKKKTLLFVSSFSTIDLPETEPHGCDEKYFHLRKNISIETQTTILGWFAQFAQKYPDFQIIYRYHPAENFSHAVQQLAGSCTNIYAIADQPIRYWLMTCDKLYNWASTCMVEMFCTGKDTYLLRPVELPRSMDYAIFEGADCIKSYEAFEQSVLEEKMSAFPVPIQKMLQWYDITDEPTYQRIGDFLIELYNSNSYTFRPSAVNMHGFTLYAFKKKLKSLLVHSKMDRFFALFGHHFAEKFDRIREGVVSEENYAVAKREKDGYIQSRAHLNGTSEQEIQETIEDYRKRILQ